MMRHYLSYIYINHCMDNDIVAMIIEKEKERSHTGSRPASIMPA